MADLLFITIVCAFFGLAALLVHACDRIIGPEGSLVPSDELSPAEGKEAA